MKKSDITIWNDFVKKYERKDIEYRGFVIVKSVSAYEQPYFWQREGDETGHSVQTIEQAKKEIDQWYLDNSVYLVKHSSSLDPVEFNYMSEAVGFCRFWGIDMTMITHSLR